MGLGLVQEPYYGKRKKQVCTGLKLTCLKRMLRIKLTDCFENIGPIYHKKIRNDKHFSMNWQWQGPRKVI